MFSVGHVEKVVAGVDYNGARALDVGIFDHLATPLGVDQRHVGLAELEAVVRDAAEKIRVLRRRIRYRGVLRLARQRG